MAIGTGLEIARGAAIKPMREPGVWDQAVWLPCSGNTGPARPPIAFTTGH